MPDESATAPPARPRVLWWGRASPDYSRNRVLAGAFESLGWSVRRFVPRSSRTARLEALVRRPPPADLIWLPCFRQRDYASGRWWAQRRHLPCIADPLISAYDKRVFEQSRYEPGARRAEALRRWESRLLDDLDAVVADTPLHAEFFAAELGVDPRRLRVIPVGAEESLFTPAPPPPADANIEALFYGSFLELHGVGTIIEAARRAAQAPVTWTLLGDGPARPAAVAAARSLPNVRFEPPVPYGALPARLARCGVALGVFGASRKAASVIPNKAHQAMACARPLVTRESAAYPPPKPDEQPGLRFVPPEDPDALASVVAELAASPGALADRGAAARRYFERCFSSDAIRAALAETLEAVRLPHARASGAGSSPASSSPASSS